MVERRPPVQAWWPTVPFHIPIIGTPLASNTRSISEVILCDEGVGSADVARSSLCVAGNFGVTVSLEGFRAAATGRLPRSRMGGKMAHHSRLCLLRQRPRRLAIWKPKTALLPAGKNRVDRSRGKRHTSCCTFPKTWPCRRSILSGNHQLTGKRVESPL